MKQLDKDFIAYLDEVAEETKQLLFDLCAIPAPSGHEEERAKFCREWLEKYGAEGVYTDDALNTVFPYKCDPDKPIVVIMAHTDTVFPDTEPFSVTVEGDVARCPGIGDDTVALSIIMMLARYFVRRNKTEKYGVLFVCNSGEEGLGNLKGVRRIIDDYGDRVELLISVDGTVNSVCNRAVGSTRYRIKIKTCGGHSFGDFGNANAIVEMAKLINALYSVDIPCVGDSKTTYNVGMISGGTSVNTIAQNVEIMYEYRSDSAECLDIMKGTFEGIIDDFKSKGVDVEVEILGERPGMGPVDQEKQKALAAICADAVENVYGFRPSFASGSTDCNIPLSRGIPAVSPGCYVGGGAHTREEWLLLSSLRPGSEAVALMLESVLE